MGIGTLKTFEPTAYELLTEIVDEARWWETIRLVADFMSLNGVERVHAKFGFVMDRHEDGFEQEPDRVVNVQDLGQLISDGLRKGTIEFKRASDFVFKSEGSRLIVMLCNDGDIHFASKDKALIFDLAHEIKEIGIKVYDNGVLI